jgi:glutaredoxin
MRPFALPLLVAGLLALGGACALADEPGDLPADVEFFTNRDCRHCAAAERFLHALEAERPELVVRTRRPLEDEADRQRFRRVVAAAKVTAASTPAFLVRGRLILGWAGAGSTGRQIGDLLDAVDRGAVAGRGPGCPVDLDRPAGQPQPPCAGPAEDTVDLPVFGRVRARDVGLPLFTVVIGLVDGFNPCAMWVLIFLLTMLVNLRSRRKMLAIAGTFVLVSGAVYFAFMAAWFTVFDLLGEVRAIQVALGLVACAVGLLNAKDFLAFHRGPSLGIPEAAKPGIYARVNRILRAENMAGALVTVIVLATMVNLVELLCTAGLPAVYTNVLARQHLPRWQYYAYLGFYQVFYMLDDSIMLGIAIVTLSRRRLQERGGRWLKLLSGIVMLLLGLVLILRPGWLSW